MPLVHSWSSRTAWRIIRIDCSNSNAIKIFNLHSSEAKALQGSYSGGLKILVGLKFEQSIPTVVHTVWEPQLWTKGIEWSDPSTMSSYSAFAPKFLDTFTLFQPFGQILPHYCIAEVAIKNSPWLHLWIDKSKPESSWINCSNLSLENSPT